MTNSYELTKLSHFSGRSGPLLLVILDGFGIGKKDAGDAVYAAHPANITRWITETQAAQLFAQLKAHGPAVGLPSNEDMGNSEVGHNAMGSGQIYNQGAKLVNESLQSGRFFQTPTWNDLIGTAVRQQKTVHLMGLLSDGNVHSHIQQLFSILDGLVRTGIKRIRVHPLLDGRDVPPDSGLEYIDQLETKLHQLETQMQIDAKIGSGGGRMYVTMDRYESNWEIVRRGWDAHVRGFIAPEDITSSYPGYFPSAKEAITTARRVYPQKLDQYNPPFVIVDAAHRPIGRMVDGDVVINFNFRGDRALEISKAFIIPSFSAFNRVEVPAVNYAGLLEYDTDKHIPSRYLVPPPDIKYISAQYLCQMKVKSFAIAETHKFGHVTYFWNGNRTGYINPNYEKYEEIVSEPNEMIESHPEMRAHEVTQRLLKVLDEGYQFIRVNYANGDMVGHTGNFQSCIRAVQTLDENVAKIVEKNKNKHGITIITADHGNIEEKLDKQGRVVTSHSLNPVPFLIIDPDFHGEYRIDTRDISDPGISNVIATVINLIGYAAPNQYQRSLVKFNL